MKLRIAIGCTICVQLLMGCGKADTKEVREILINGVKVQLKKEDLSLYEEYEKHFKQGFVILTNVSDTVQERAKKYYRGKSFFILMGKDINKDGVREYLVVEPYPGVHRGILSGVIMEENGNIQLYMDRKKGMYGPDYMVMDYKRMGLKKGEVECIRLGYSEENAERLFFIQLLDKDLNVISHHGDIFMGSLFSDIIVAYYDPETGERTYDLMHQEFLPSDEEVYKLLQRMIKGYRENKAKGIVWKYPEYEEDRKREIRK